MAFSLIASGVVQSSNTNGFTTPSFTSTNANLFVVIACSLSGAAATITDSRGLSWQQEQVGAYAHQFGLWYAVNATGGAGHTLSIAGTANYPALAYYAFSGASSSPFEDATDVAGVTAGTSLQPGAIVPALNGSLVITGIGFSSVAARSINGGFSTPVQAGLVDNIAFGVAASYLIQTTAASSNPTWSWTGNDDADVIQAVFKVGARVRTRPAGAQ